MSGLLLKPQRRRFAAAPLAALDPRRRQATTSLRTPQTRDDRGVASALLWRAHGLDEGVGLVDRALHVLDELRDVALDLDDLLLQRVDRLRVQIVLEEEDVVFERGQHRRHLRLGLAHRRDQLGVAALGVVFELFALRPKLAVLDLLDLLAPLGKEIGGHLLDRADALVDR